MSSNSSSNSGKHSYMRIECWTDPNHEKFLGHFWKTPRYTEKAKEYYRKWIAELSKDRK